MTMQLRYSNDGGHPCGDWRNLDVGVTGDFLKPLVVRRLGRAEHRIWELQDTSPYCIAILAASIQAEPE